MSEKETAFRNLGDTDINIKTKNAAGDVYDIHLIINDLLRIIPFAYGFMMAEKRFIPNIIENHHHLHATPFGAIQQ